MPSVGPPNSPPNAMSPPGPRAYCRSSPGVEILSELATGRWLALRLLFICGALSPLGEYRLGLTTLFFVQRPV
jgi:hypothetical protein